LRAKLIYIYWNLNALNKESENEDSVTKTYLSTEERRNPRDFDFPHPTLSICAERLGIETNSEYNTDDILELESEVSDTEDICEFKVDNHITYSGEYKVLPVPARVPADVLEGARCAVYFADEFNDWYEGIVFQVKRKNTRSTNLVITFNNNESSCAIVATADNYGPNKVWILLGELHTDLEDVS
jgi:hypothetical protein